MKTVSLPDGTGIPVLGQGTWQMGERKSARAVEIAALRLGIELGLTLIDTAEMYAQGGAEEVVADAIAGRRERVFVVSKAFPHHASRRDLPKACERSLKRLRIDALDLYLLHWQSSDSRSRKRLKPSKNSAPPVKFAPGACPTSTSPRWKNSSSFEVARIARPTRSFITSPSVESSLISSTGAGNAEIPIMAYSPLGHGRGLLDHAALKQIAQRHNASSAQVALAWVLRQPNIIAIPKASREAHVRANAASVGINLTDQDLAHLDNAFPPPRSKVPLAIL